MLTTGPDDTRPGPTKDHRDHVCGVDLLPLSLLSFFSRNHTSTKTEFRSNGLIGWLSVISYLTICELILFAFGSHTPTSMQLSHELVILAILGIVVEVEDGVVDEIQVGGARRRRRYRQLAATARRVLGASVNRHPVPVVPTIATSSTVHAKSTVYVPSRHRGPI